MWLIAGGLVCLVMITSLVLLGCAVAFPKFRLVGGILAGLGFGVCAGIVALVILMISAM